MMKIERSFPIIEIMGRKSENLLFHDICLNKDISITVQDMAMKFWVTNLYIHSKGRVSQILYLGRSFFNVT